MDKTNTNTIDGLITRHARYWPDHLGVIFEEHRLSWREFNARVNRLSNALLDMGLSKGDKVATILPNCLEVLDTYWAAAKTGIVVVPLNPLLRGRGLTTLLNDSDALAVITTGDMIEHLDPLRSSLPEIDDERYIVAGDESRPGWTSYGPLVSRSRDDEPPAAGLNGDDLYNIMYSSGTTGSPKGIMHTHHIRAMYGLTCAVGCRIVPESVVLHTGSLSFNGAFITLAPAFLQGATYILHPSFEVERLIQTVADERVTHVVMVPSQIVAMLRSPHFDSERLSSLEMILTVGAPLHLEHKRELNDRLPGRFYELYGLTEGLATLLDKTMYQAKPESVGPPMHLTQMKIVGDDGHEVPAGEVGEIVGRGPITMTGYYKRPDLTAEAIRDGWLHTGDMGYVDEDGFLYLVDRMKDMIISGGINVYPRDIEEVVVQHPTVAEAAVFGVPDEKWGEAPVAAVILLPHSDTTADELQSWINARVEARYQKVREVIVCDDFPRSVAGKTLKRVMRDAFWENEGRKI